MYRYSLQLIFVFKESFVVECVACSQLFFILVFCFYFIFLACFFVSFVFFLFFFFVFFY